MNERIKELAERAGFVLWGDESWNPGEVIDWSSRYDDELEKFAQLIVRECADIAYDTQYNHGRASYETGSCARAIRQHFGVGVIHLPSAVTTVPTMTSMPTARVAIQVQAGADCINDPKTPEVSVMTLSALD